MNPKFSIGNVVKVQTNDISVFTLNGLTGSIVSIEEGEDDCFYLVDFKVELNEFHRGINLELPQNTGFYMQEVELTLVSEGPIAVMGFVDTFWEEN